MDDLTAWASEQNTSQKVFLSKPSMYLPGASYAVYEALPEEMVALEDSPILFKKSVKNQVEADGMVAAHLRDAYAKCKFLAEMESDIVRDDNSMDWTEMSAAERYTVVFSYLFVLFVVSIIWKMLFS